MSFHIIPVLYLPQVLHLLYAVQVSDIEYSLTAIEQKTSVKKKTICFSLIHFKKASSNPVELARTKVNRYNREFAVRKGDLISLDDDAGLKVKGKGRRPSSVS